MGPKQTKGRNIDDIALEVLKDGDEAVRAYLGQVWLCEAMDALVEARKAAGLTQEALAFEMGIKQSGVGRWERDTEGGMTLRSMLKYAQACGLMPVLSFEPTEAVRMRAVKRMEEASHA